MRDTESAVQRYEPQTPSAVEGGGLVRWIMGEFRRIARALNATIDGQYEQQTTEPPKPRLGMVRLADGTEWNPGRGAGLYLYEGAWDQIYTVPTGVDVFTRSTGGAVTQATSKSTGVTLNTDSGEITMNAAALAADTVVSFTLTNSTIRARDLLVLNHVTTGTRGAYDLNAQCSSGSAIIYVANRSTGSLSEAIVIRFTRIPGAVS